MLEFTLSQRIKIRVHASCPEHPRYSPERDGPGAIKGNCRYCLALLDVWKAKGDVERAIRCLEILAGPFRPQKRTHKPPAAS